MFFSHGLKAQVTIGSGTAPQSFSILEVVSNDVGGVRLPHLTTAQRNTLSATSDFQSQKHRGDSTNDLYDVTVVVGSSYANAYFIDETTGRFILSFLNNSTTRERIAIVRVSNNCTNEYKEFVSAQAGADICETAATFI